MDLVALVDLVDLALALGGPKSNTGRGGQIECLALVDLADLALALGGLRSKDAFAPWVGVGKGGVWICWLWWT